MRIFIILIIGALAILLTHTISAAQFYACDDPSSSNLGTIEQPFNNFEATDSMIVGDNLALCDGECIPSLVTDGVTGGDYVLTDSTGAEIQRSPDQSVLEERMIAELRFNPDGVYQITGGDSSVTTGRCQ